MRALGRGLAAVLAVVFVLFVCSAVALGATASSGLVVHVLAAPSSFSGADNFSCFEDPETNPGEFKEAEPCDQYKVLVTNSGSEPTKGPLVVSDTLPAGLSVESSELFVAFNQESVDKFELPEGEPASECLLGGGGAFACESFEVEGSRLGECEGLSGGSGVRCEFPGALGPDQRLELDVRVRVAAGASSGAENLVEVSEAGRRVARGETADVVSAGDLAAPFGPSALVSLMDGVDGAPDVQAGDHPYELATELDMSTRMGQGPETARRAANSGGGGVRDVVVDLPPGLVGSAQAAPKCTLAQLQSQQQCPPDSLVGHLDTQPSLAIDANSPVYNLVPEQGVAAEFGFLDILHGTHVIDASLAPTPEGYVVRATAREVPDLLLWDVISTFYGDPAARNGGAAAPAAMFTNSADCSGEALVSRAWVDSWQDPGSFYADGAPDVEGLGAEGWSTVSSEAPPVIGCDELRFEPERFSFAPEPAYSHADEPSGYESVLKIPQSETPGTLATPPLKSTVVTLPPGVSISPSAAGGLQACSAEQFGFTGVNPSNQVEEFTQAPAACPEASRIGTVEVLTPLLEEPLSGSVFVAQPGCSGGGCEAAAEDGGLFGIYMEIGSEKRGLHVKLVGNVEVGGEGHRNGLAPGQIRTSFLRTPQAPFSELRFKFNGGPRAPLANPQSCGTFTTVAELEPWSAPQSGPNARKEPSFVIAGGCGDGFAPGFAVNMGSLQAAAYSPFSTTFTRHDTEQDLAGVEVRMPEGLLAKIAGVTQCPEAQANAGECPASSRIGTVTASAGSGPDPYWQSGSVYLTGPYNNGPFGLSIVVPAVAGPYNLGLIVTRASIRVNPSTAQATVLSNPLPQSVDGVPLRIQTVNVTVGENDAFTFNATSCTEKQVTAALAGNAGAGTTRSQPYGPVNCAKLPFHPDFTASTLGKTSKADGASLTVKITAKPGEANIAKTDLTIPKILPSRLTTLQQACTEAQFDSNPAGCPVASIIATATVHTPLLNSPLTGPAYFVSHGGAAFPDVEIVLQGENVELVLDGHTQIKDGITYSRFETVPDAPFTTFEFNAPEGPYSIFTTEKPGQTNLCALTKTITVKKRVTVKRHGRTIHTTKKTKKRVSTSLTIPTIITGQNGATINQQTKVAVTGCPTHKPNKPKKKKQHKKKK